MKIVYVGDLNSKATSRLRFEWMLRIGHEVYGVDQDKYFPSDNPRFLKRIELKLGLGSGYRVFNNEILSTVKKVKPAILWIDKGVRVYAQTLAQCKSLCQRIVSFHMDDPFTKRGGKGWHHHFAGLGHYDVIFVTKQEVALDYHKLGVPHAYRCFPSFDPMLHRPLFNSVPIPNISKSVIFLGFLDVERIVPLEKILTITPNLYVSIWGKPNCRSQALSSAGVLHYGGLWCDDYASALSQAGIVLAFLTRKHRDFCTTRSFEVPACGGFMLAERTVEHQMLFREGEEAEFWGDIDELGDKVKYYLNHPEEPRAIGARGRERCLKSGYGYDQCIPRWLEYAMNPKGWMVSDFETIIPKR